MRTLALVVMVAFPCFADDVLLKDGRRIEFRSVEDSGETYTIVTPEGARISVKRSEVDGFAKTEPAVALTGATMSFDKRAKTDSVDLLKRLDTGRDTIDGTWKISGGALLGSASTDGAARIQIPYGPSSEEYNLTVVLERTDGDDNVGVGFPTPGGSAMYHLDVDRGAYHGLLAPDGAGHRKVTSSPGKQLVAGKSRTIVFMVRRTALVVQVDGRDVCTVRVDWSKVSALPQCAPTQREAFAIFALKSGVKVSRMTVTTVTTNVK